MGRFFEAAFTGRLAKGNAHCSNEAAGLGVLWKYGFQPQRVAAWIYMQALVLLWKGVPFFSPPDPSYQARVEGAATTAPNRATGTHFVWRDAPGWPWRA